MNEELKKKLEAAIAACTERATSKETTVNDALEYTQAAVNAANALITISNIRD